MAFQSFSTVLSLPMRILKAIYRVFAAVIDVKMGLAGALFLGVVVFCINYSHGWQFGLSAASKQAVYTFFFGGFITKLCEYLSTRIDKRFWAHFLGALIPTLLSIGATFGVHSLKGTPEPLYSTLPTILITFPAFIAISFRKRKKHLEKLSEESETEPILDDPDNG